MSNITASIQGKIIMEVNDEFILEQIRTTLQSMGDTCKNEALDIIRKAYRQLVEGNGLDAIDTLKGYLDDNGGI